MEAQGNVFDFGMCVGCRFQQKSCSAAAAQLPSRIIGLCPDMALATPLLIHTLIISIILIIVRALRARVEVGSLGVRIDAHEPTIDQPCYRKNELH